MSDNSQTDATEAEEIVVTHQENDIEVLCKRLKIITIDVDRVLKAKDLLASLQRRRAFQDLFGLEANESLIKSEDYNDISPARSIHNMTHVLGDDIDEMEAFEGLSEDICMNVFDEERWGNFFPGYEILGVPEDLNTNENNKCIELTIGNCSDDLQVYLKCGIRCFLLDLFRGPQSTNQDLIVQLREAEIAVSKEYEFPVVSTIMARLSPRYQYSGYLDPLYGDSVELKRGTKLTLTVNRCFSSCSTPAIIYVNARFLLCDVRRFDIILIGEDIQIMVKSVRTDHLNCCVCRGGIFRSYMPVLFPARCSRYRISYEEVEDLTFAREVGIKVVVSDIVGTEKYLDNLEKAMITLHCEQLRIYARLVLNEIDGCDGEQNWVAHRYDGFLVELAEPALVPDIMRLCPNAECIMQLAYAAKKPIILDAWPINEKRLHIDPQHYYYIYFYPDKYLVRSQQSRKFFYFSFLQNALFEQILPVSLAKMPHCDNSHTGADGLARALVTASMEVDAKAIVVCGVTTRMVQKISHFRPRMPILFVSHMSSAEDYVSLYHNVTMLSFRTQILIDHQGNVFRKSVFALAYLSNRNIVKDGDHIILVYNFAEGLTFPEKYLIYKFNKKNFVQHLSGSLFPKKYDAPSAVVPFMMM